MKPHFRNHPVGRVFVTSNGVEFLFKPDLTGSVQITFNGRKFAITGADMKEFIELGLGLGEIELIDEGKSVDEAA